MSGKPKATGYFTDADRILTTDEEPSPPPSDELMKKLSQFEARRTRGVWPHIQRAALARSLRARLYNPTQADQASTSLCGVLAMVRVWAQDIPDTYLEFAMALYDKGAGSMRGRDSTAGRVIKPTDELRNANPPPNIPVADWIVSASIRESLNLVFNYTPDEGLFQIKAFTWPWDAEKQFRALGYTRIRGHFTPAQTQGYESLMEASKLYQSGWRVIMLINHWLIQQSNPTPMKVPNHYVGLASAITPRIASGVPTLNPFMIWSWGSFYRVPKNGNYQGLQAVVENYYGFVAGRF